MPDVDLSFFDAVQFAWSFIFGFFPDWVQAVLIVAIGLYVASLAILLVKFIKDLLWPF